MSKPSIIQLLQDVKYYFHGEVCSLYDLGFLEGGCTRVGVPYIYMYGRRAACGGAFSHDQYYLDQVVESG